MNKKLTFDDIRIEPTLTDIESRSECDTSCTLGPYELEVPLIVASMHSLVTKQMVNNVDQAGSMVVQPRNIQYLDSSRIALSTGLNNATTRAKSLPKGGILSVEIANGYQRRMVETLEEIRRLRHDVYILAGTVCTYEGYRFLSGFADAILMGIGVGNACTTTVNTGVGLPAAEMLSRMRRTRTDKPIILCGGVRTYGDTVKAVALGASVVMSGYLFKDCYDTGSRYYGEASEQNKEEQKYIEGTEIEVASSQKSSYRVIKEFRQALQSAMSYSNSRTIEEFQRKVMLT